jgi:NAD(P)H-dependent FMN reductase
MSVNNTPLKLEVVLGSVREGRFGEIPFNWIGNQARQSGEFEVGAIDLAQYQIPNDFSRNADVEELAARMEAADAVIVLSPEYNHSYSAPIKTFIDAMPKSVWQAKPVGFVAYGGFAAGLRAVEALRLVFAELHAVTMRDVVSFYIMNENFDASGEPIQADAVNGAARVLLGQLSWWALALKDAKAVRPYGQAVLV